METAFPVRAPCRADIHPLSRRRWTHVGFRQGQAATRGGRGNGNGAEARQRMGQPRPGCACVRRCPPTWTRSASWPRWLETWRRLLAADVTFTTAEAAEEERREPECPGLAPDPLHASTPAEFTAALKRFRLWAGEPSFREMARHARPTVSPSTLATAGHAEQLPTLRVVAAFVTGCGGGPEELARFAAAWRRIRLSGRSRHLDSEPQEHGTCTCGASRPVTPW